MPFRHNQIVNVNELIESQHISNLEEFMQTPAINMQKTVKSKPNQNRAAEPFTFIPTSLGSGYMTENLESKLQSMNNSYVPSINNSTRNPFYLDQVDKQD